VRIAFFVEVEADGVTEDILSTDEGEGLVFHMNFNGLKLEKL
jgi:hypothetical protein